MHARLNRRQIIFVFITANARARRVNSEVFSYTTKILHFFFFKRYVQQKLKRADRSGPDKKKAPAFDGRPVTSLADQNGESGK